MCIVPVIFFAMKLLAITTYIIYMVSKIVFGNIVQRMFVILLSSPLCIALLVITKIHCFHCSIQSKFQCHFLNLLRNYSLS